MTNYSINELSINDEISLDDGSLGRIISIAKGWIGLDDGRKVRAKRINSIEVHNDRFLPIEDESDEDNDESPRGGRMARTLRKYRGRYLSCKSSSGRKSLNNGDPIAEALEGMDHVAVAALADHLLNEEPGYHFSRYGHLNNGSIRMNSGNRIRAAVKRGELAIETVIDAAS